MTAHRIALVVGTRPELIKMAPVLLELRKRPGIAATFIATAQHRQMLDQACAAFGISPDIDLDLMRPDQSLTDITTGVLSGMQETFAQLKPDAVLVHGDTTTCFATTLAAFYANVPVGHVEAGLRTYDFNAPWPEEMNRRLVDPLCRWCFAPTPRAAENLRAERISEDRIHVTGNTAVDALLLALQRSRAHRSSIPGLSSDALDGKRLVLVTGHRRESFGEPFRELCLALRDIVEMHRDVAIIYPVHLNPNVQRPVREILGDVERVHLIPPLEYLPFVSLLERSTLIVTDSGGIQEEAPTLRKPVLVMRRATERPEAVELGLAKLVGTSRHAIVNEASRLLDDPAAYAEMITDSNPYGDGRAAERIADVLEQTFTRSRGNAEG
jgi:UDP-N-acetylglucosamine 2-epimerase (non-hydrolysing)